MRERPALFRDRSADVTHASRVAAAAWARRAGLAVAAALFLSFSGAFGSASAPFGRRIIYWLAAIGGGTLIAIGVGTLFLRRDWNERSFWLHAGLRTVLSAAPITLLVWFLAAKLFPEAGFRLAELPDFLLPVLVVTIVMIALTAVISRTPAITHAAASTEPSRPAPPGIRLLDRLPLRLRGARLLAVEAEDHYLRLHTTQGSELILMRLADALAELDGIEGAQIHRSWWVARAAVVAAERADGRTLLSLHGGLHCPVSRTYVKALREAGWF